MTKKRIEIIRKLLIPFVKKTEEFEKGLNKALDSVNKALEQTTSDDCVSREKVWYMITGGKYANEDYEQFIDRLVKELENMPPVTPTQSWISVSERLPTKEEHIANNGLFIVSDGNRTYAEFFDVYNSMKYFGEPTIYGFKVDRCVTAWMPLPKPYEGGTKC